MTVSRMKKVDKGLEGRLGEDSARAGSDSSLSVLDGDIHSRSTGKSEETEKIPVRPRDGGDWPGHESYQ